MISKEKHEKFISLILFLGSPFLAFPLILRGIYFKSKFYLNLFALLSGVIAYMYIPHIANDKASYFLTYVRFSGYNWSEFLNYLSLDPNVIFNLLLYYSARLGISFQLLFFFFTYFVVGSVLHVFNELTKESSISRKTYFFFFVLLVLSFSMPRLFSGIKFYLGTTLLLLCFYEGILKKNNVRGLVFLFLAVLTHFSVIAFVPVYFAVKFFPDKTRLFRIIFICSFAFLLIPKDIVSNIINSLGLSGGYANKVDVYLENKDFVEEGLRKGTTSTLIVYICSIIWSYGAYLYLIFKAKMKSQLRNIVYLVFAVTNLFYNIPFIFSRYLVFVSILFALLLISESSALKSRKILYVFVFLFFLNFSTDLITMRYNIEKSFFSFDSVTSVSIFMKDKITYLDFLRGK